jgi:hypothetical protein
LPTLLLKRRDIIDLAKRLGRSLGVLYQYSDDYSDEKIERGDVANIVTEIRDALSKLRNILGEAFAPFEKLVKHLIEKALEGSLTVSRSFIT